MACRKCTRIEIHTLTPDGLQVSLFSGSASQGVHAASVGLVLITRPGFDTGRCGCSPVRSYSHHGVISTAGVCKPCTPHSSLGLRELCHPAQAMPTPAPPLVVPEKGRVHGFTRRRAMPEQHFWRRGRRRTCCSSRQSATSSACWSGTAELARLTPRPAHTHAQPVPAVCPQQPQRCGSQAQARQAPKLNLLTKDFATSDMPQPFYLLCRVRPKTLVCL